MKKIERAQKIIEHYSLTEHPEGGYYRRVYQSDKITETPSGTRFLQTSIYYLLIGTQKSALHRLKSDEIWFWHEGSSVKIYCISPSGEKYNLLLGTDFTKKQAAQRIIPSGTWFSAEPENKKSYAFVSSTVSPGFDFDDFELAQQAKP